MRYFERQILVHRLLFWVGFLCTVSYFVLILLFAMLGPRQSPYPLWCVGGFAASVWLSHQMDCHLVTFKHRYRDYLTQNPCDCFFCS